MTRTVHLTIDGKPAEVPEGTTLRAACEAQGIQVPTLCWAENLVPANVCRVCVVEVEGARVLVPACSRAVEPGMVIHTDSERVRTSRKLVLELLGSSVDMSQSGDFQAYATRYGADPARFGPAATVAEPPRVDNALFVRDYAKCMLCTKCVQACGEEAQNSFAIAVAGRGFDARISTEYEVSLPESACVFCGNCIGWPMGRVQAGRHGHRLRLLRRGLHADAPRAGQHHRPCYLALGQRRHPRPPLCEGPLRLGLRGGLTGPAGSLPAA